MDYTNVISLQRKGKKPNRRMGQGHEDPYKRRNTDDQLFGERCCLIRHQRCGHQFSFINLQGINFTHFFFPLELHSPEILGTVGKDLYIRMSIKFLFILVKTEKKKQKKKKTIQIVSRKGLNKLWYIQTIN